MKILILLFVFTYSCVSYGMSAKEYLKRVQSNYTSLESFETIMEYQLIRGFESNQVLDRYSGIYKSSGNNSYRQIGPAEFINDINENLLLKINHEKESIILSNAIDESSFNADINKSLKMCSSVKAEKNDNRTVISLVLLSGTDFPYSRMDIEVDKKFWITKLTMYYASKMNFAGSYAQPDYDYAKLVITYNEFKKKWKDKDGLLDVSKYIQKQENNYIVTDMCQSYSIIDLRK